MTSHPSTKTNLEKLEGYGNSIIEAEHGELASGLVGTGRMAEPEHILEVLEKHFNKKKALTGKRVLITAGPTYEAIDPVRFIGNHSSGKMGFAIAEFMAEQGAKVHLVSGPTQLSSTHKNIKTERVTSAEEMYDACVEQFGNADISVLAAAVADYKPVVAESQKIKKKTDTLHLDLTKTKDIAAELGQRKKNGQMIVGFALETENEQANALKKIKSKNFDMIVLNSLKDEGAGFGHDTNKISIIDKQNNIHQFGLKSKREVAQDIVNSILHALD